MKKTAYTIKMEYPLYLDIEVEAENIETARKEAADIAEATPIAEWQQWSLPSVYETEWVDEDGIHNII